jgi:hypothetical protein
MNTQHTDAEDSAVTVRECIDCRRRRAARSLTKSVSKALDGGLWRLSATVHADAAEPNAIAGQVVACSRVSGGRPDSTHGRLTGGYLNDGEI